MRNRVVFLPVIFFFALVIIFALVLTDNHNQGNSSFETIEKQIPAFSIPSLQNDKNALTEKDLQGRVMLVNVFASWCVPCRAEHPVLLRLKEQGIAIIGINYKDTTENALRYLNEMGNPYLKTGFDPKGIAGEIFSITGVPETFVIDEKGAIRAHITGPVTGHQMRKQLMPLIKNLTRESTAP